MTRALANLILWCNKNEFIMNEQDKFVDKYNTAKASLTWSVSAKYKTIKVSLINTNEK